MAVLLFCICSAFVARYFNKRSTLLFVMHSIFFIMVIPFLCFASNTQFIVEIMQRICGQSIYQAIRLAVTVPCVWLYSTNIVLFIIEIVMLIAVLIGAAIHVTRKLILSGKDPFEYKSHKSSGVQLPCNVNFLYYFYRIFLKFGKLLN